MLVALLLVGCVERKSDRRDAARPAPVEQQPDAVEEPAGEEPTVSDTVVGTVPSANPVATETTAEPPRGAPVSAPAQGAAPPPVSAPAPPTTIDDYNPELVDWCADVDQRMGEVQDLTEFSVESALITLDHLRAIRSTAPPEIHAALDDLISALELLQQGLERGEITDPKASLVRWALLNLGPERIASLRTSFDYIFSFVNRNCLDA